MKLLYYLAAIGKPNLDQKLEFLVHNLNYIHSNINQTFDININSYELDTTIIEWITQKIANLHFIDNFFIHKKKGILTELFLTNPYNKQMHNYDHILFILDDVKIINMDIQEMIRIKTIHKIKLLSPKIIGAWWPWMFSMKNITIHNFLEIFLILATPADLEAYFNINTVDNKWMWGVDFLFGYYKMRTGIINTYVAKHMFAPRMGDDTLDAQKRLEQYLHKYTPYSDLDNIKQTTLPISEEIGYVDGKWQRKVVRHCSWTARPPFINIT